MVGRGRGRISDLRDDKEKVHGVNLSIDDLIKMGRGGGKIIYDREMKGTMGFCNTQGHVSRTYQEDGFKSLDQVVKERGILKTPSKNTKFDKDNLPITGKKPKTARFRTSLNVGTARLDPMDSSVDATISSQGKVVAGGASSSNQLKKQDEDTEEDETEGRFRMKTRVQQKGSTFIRSKTGTLDPMTSSLDDVIADRLIQKEEGAGYTKRSRSKKRRRNDVDEEDLMDLWYGWW